MSHSHPSVVVARYDFVSDVEGDLCFEKNDRIRVLDSSGQHWWRGRHLSSQQEGMFPVNYVEVDKKPPPPPPRPQKSSGSVSFALTSAEGGESNRGQRVHHQRRRSSSLPAAEVPPILDQLPPPAAKDASGASSSSSSGGMDGFSAKKVPPVPPPRSLKPILSSDYIISPASRGSSGAEDSGEEEEEEESTVDTRTCRVNISELEKILGPRSRKSRTVPASFRQGQMPSHVEETCGQEEASSSALSSHSRVRSLAPTKHISLGDELKSVLEQSFRRKQQQHIHSGRTASKEAEDAFVTSSVEASESPRSRPALLVRKLSAIQQLVGTPGAEEAARKLQIWCRFHLQRKTQLRQELQAQPPLLEAKKLRARNFFFRELLATERAYVNSLDYVLRRFDAPCRKDNIIKAASLDKIFGQVGQVCSFQHQFLQELEACVRQFEEKNCFTLGALFMHWAPFFKIYTDFVNKYEESVQTLQRCMSRKASFAKFLERAYCDAESQGLSLESFLVKPIQRIPRYRLLLADICKHTPTSYRDYQSLKDSLEKVGEIADFINQKKRESDEFQLVLRLRKRFPNLKFLIQPHRKLQKLDTLQVSVERNLTRIPGLSQPSSSFLPTFFDPTTKELKGKKSSLTSSSLIFFECNPQIQGPPPQSSHPNWSPLFSERLEVVLFSDLILFVPPEGCSKSIHRLGGVVYLMFCDLQVDIEDCDCAFRLISCDGTSFTFTFQDSDMANSWKHDVGHCFSLLQNSLRIRLSGKDQDMLLAMVQEREKLRQEVPHLTALLWQMTDQLHELTEDKKEVDAMYWELFEEMKRLKAELERVEGQRAILRDSQAALSEQTAQDQEIVKQKTSNFKELDGSLFLLMCEDAFLHRNFFRGMDRVQRRKPADPVSNSRSSVSGKKKKKVPPSYSLAPSARTSSPFPLPAVGTRAYSEAASSSAFPFRSTSMQTVSRNTSHSLGEENERLRLENEQAHQEIARLRAMLGSEESM